MRPIADEYTQITTSINAALCDWAGGPMHVAVCDLNGGNTFNSWAIAIQWSPDKLAWFPVQTDALTDGSTVGLSFTGKGMVSTAPLGRGFLRAVSTGGVNATGGVKVFIKPANVVQTRH